MKIIKSILNMVTSPEVTTAEELKEEDPINAEEIIKANETEELLQTQLQLLNTAIINMGASN